MSAPKLLQMNPALKTIEEQLHRIPPILETGRSACKPRLKLAKQILKLRKEMNLGNFNSPGSSVSNGTNKDHIEMNTEGTKTNLLDDYGEIEEENQKKQELAYTISRLRTTSIIDDWPKVEVESGKTYDRGYAPPKGSERNFCSGPATKRVVPCTGLQGIKTSCLDSTGRNSDSPFEPWEGINPSLFDDFPSVLPDSLPIPPKRTRTSLFEDVETIRDIQKQDVRIQELEQENAELRTRLRHTKSSNSQEHNELDSSNRTSTEAR